MSIDPDFRHRRPGRRGFFPLIAAVLALALGGIVMLLWNAILPAVLHTGRISYWQAVGLLVLCRILFGNFGRGFGSGGTGGRHRIEGFNGMREKWMRMSPDERRAFKEQWRRRCERWPRPDGDTSDRTAE